MQFGTPQKIIPTFKFGKPISNNTVLVKDIVTELGSQKPKFMSHVQSEIKKYIKSQSPSDCLTLVSRYSDGSVEFHWYPSEVLKGYTGRMIAFLRSRKYEGKSIDSALTDPVVGIVSESFSKFYSDNSIAIAKPLLDQLLNDKVFVSQLSSQIVEISGGVLPTYLKAELSKAVMHYIEDNIQTNIVHSSANQLQHLATNIISHATAVPITTAISAVLVKNMALFLKGAIAKMLATTAGKAMLVGVAKKIVAGQILAFLISTVGASLGGSTVALIVAPLLAAYIAYEISNLPEELSEKVSSAVSKELSGEFDKVNKNMATQLVKAMSMGALSSFASDVVHDDAFKELLKQLKKGLQP